MDSGSLDLTDKEITQAFSDPAWAEKFPPILTVDKAAELAVVPKATIYAWSSAGHLRGCSRKVGKHLRIFRDRFIKRLFNEGDKASAIDSAMKGMTEYQWRVLKRAIRERIDPPDHLLNLAAGRNAIRDVVEAAMQKPSGKRRVRVARFLQSPPFLTDEPEETRSTFPEDALPADADISSIDPSIPKSSEDNSSEASDPSDVNVDDWEIASPDL